MQLLSNSPSYLKSHASQVKSPVIRENVNKMLIKKAWKLSTSQPAKIMQQTLMKDMSKRLEDRAVFRDRQHGFTLGRST